MKGATEKNPKLDFLNVLFKLPFSRLKLELRVWITDSWNRLRCIFEAQEKHNNLKQILVLFWKLILRYFLIKRDVEHCHVSFQLVC